MKQKIFFFFLLGILIILFGFLYLLGIMNLFEFKIIKDISWLDFSFLDNSIKIMYFVILTIFFILGIAYMIRNIQAIKEENQSLTSLNVDELSIKKTGNENLTNSFDKLVDSLNKNINAIQNYKEILDSDIDKIDGARFKTIMQEEIDSIYQEFSQMINDFVITTTIGELLEKVIYWGVSFSKSKRGSIMVANKNKELYIYKTIGWEPEEKENIKNIKIPLGTGIAGKVASENKRIFVTNIENYHDHEFKYKEKYQTNSFVSMPIMGINKVFAVLNLTESKNEIYSMNELEILNIITKLSSKIFELIQIKKKLV